MGHENPFSCDQVPGPHPLASFPTTGRLLGIDFGTKRVGVAVSDVDQRYAAPVGMFARSSSAAEAAALRRFVEDNQAVGLVVGLPVHKSGDEGTKARQAREFGTWAGRAVHLPVVYWDERHTSTIAEGYLAGTGLSEKKQKSRLDALAAQIMLQAYLDAPDRSLWSIPPRGDRRGSTPVDPDARNHPGDGRDKEC